MPRACGNATDNSRIDGPGTGSDYGSCAELKTGRAAPESGARLLAFPVPLAILGSIAAALIVAVAMMGVQRMRYAHHKETAGTTAGPSHVNGAALAQDARTNPRDDAAAPGMSGKLAPPSQSFEMAALDSLADLHLPDYQQPQLRGVESTDAGHELFLTGMQAYSKGDCAGAIASLAKVPVAEADGVAARLYSGLCQLRERELGDAQTSFTTVIAAGDSPQLETAEYFLAQTRILGGDFDGARKWLNEAITLRGDYEEKARKQEQELAQGSTQRSR